MGFARVWVDRIMKCVSTVSYQVRVNNSISSVIIPSRGLRQGDPLSPYLFLFCTEFLNAKLQQGVSKNLISSIKICKKAPVVSHLFFADDSIFFVKADVNEARNLKTILHQYEIMSGQMINFDKSEVCFSKNTPADNRVDFCNFLRIPQVNSHSRYLGLPLVVGQRKTEAFRGILDKMWRKAMPVYMMSVYHAPRKIFGEMYMLISQYWWDKEDGKGVSWVSKGTLQKKKCDGGLGFKDLYTFNDAMLMKIGWRMMKFPGLLMSQILVARNRVWHEKDSWSIERAVIIGKNILNLLEHSHWSVPLPNANVNESWIPPAKGKIKINVDGSWEASSREAGLGIVARDHLGSVQWCWAVHGKQGTCPSEVEVMPC
ncbi:hypothetical protein QQ045_009916 [Rhodiola kirilowii]